MVENVIPQPGAKYAPLPIDEDGCLLAFTIHVGQGQTPKTVIRSAGLNPKYYKWAETGKPGKYSVTGRYTCSP